jgi:hypothetical protein
VFRGRCVSFAVERDTWLVHTYTQPISLLGQPGFRAGSHWVTIKAECRAPPNCTIPECAENFVSGLHGQPQMLQQKRRTRPSLKFISSFIPSCVPCSSHSLFPRHQTVAVYVVARHLLSIRLESTHHTHSRRLKRRRLFDGSGDVGTLWCAYLSQRSPNLRYLRLADERSSCLPPSMDCSRRLPVNCSATSRLETGLWGTFLPLLRFQGSFLIGA